MAFPTTGLLDDFNRANAGSLGANWTDSIDGGSGGWKIVSNQAEPTGSFGSSYWNVAQYGPDVEVYVTRVDTIATPERLYLYARITATGASSTAYIFRCSTSGSATTHGFEKNVAGVNSAIGADFTVTLAAGDGIGFEISGTTLRAWRKPAAGAWAQMDVDHTDSSISAAGNIGIQGSQTLIQVDDFSGGTIVSAIATAAYARLMRIPNPRVGPMALRHQFRSAYWPTSSSSSTQTFPQALTATATTTSSIAKLAAKTVTATSTSTASIVKSIGKPLSATATTTATLLKQVGKLITATVTTSATLAKTKTIVAALTATVTSTASITKQIAKSVSATVTSTASIVRVTGKALTATVTTTASLVRRVNKNLSATVTTSATLAVTKAILLTLTANVSSSASIVRQVGKSLTATATSTASMSRKTTKLVTATVTSTATVARSIAKALTATVTSTASLVRSKIVHLTLTATVTVTGILTAGLNAITAYITSWFDQPRPKDSLAGKPTGGFDPPDPREG